MNQCLTKMNKIKEGLHFSSDTAIAPIMMDMDVLKISRPNPLEKVIKFVHQNGLIDHLTYPLLLSLKGSNHLRMWSTELIARSRIFRPESRMLFESGNSIPRVTSEGKLQGFYYALSIPVCDIVNPKLLQESLKAYQDTVQKEINKYIEKHSMKVGALTFNFELFETKSFDVNRIPSGICSMSTSFKMKVYEFLAKENLKSSKNSALSSINIEVFFNLSKETVDGIEAALVLPEDLVKTINNNIIKLKIKTVKNKAVAELNHRIKKTISLLKTGVSDILEEKKGLENEAIAELRGSFEQLEALENLGALGIKRYELCTYFIKRLLDLNYAAFIKANEKNLIKNSIKLIEGALNSYFLNKPSESLRDEITGETSKALTELKSIRDNIKTSETVTSLKERLFTNMHNITTMSGTIEQKEECVRAIIKAFSIICGATVLRETGYKFVTLTEIFYNFSTLSNFITLKRYLEDLDKEKLLYSLERSFNTPQEEETITDVDYQYNSGMDPTHEEIYSRMQSMPFDPVFNSPSRERGNTRRVRLFGTGPSSVPSWQYTTITQSNSSLTDFERAEPEAMNQTGIHGSSAFTTPNDTEAITRLFEEETPDGSAIMEEVARRSVEEEGDTPRLTEPGPF